MQLKYAVHSFFIPRLYRHSMQPWQQPKTRREVLKYRIIMQFSLFIEAPWPYGFTRGQFVERCLIRHEHLFFFAHFYAVPEKSGLSDFRKIKKQNAGIEVVLPAVLPAKQPSAIIVKNAGQLNAMHILMIELLGILPA